MGGTNTKASRWSGAVLGCCMLGPSCVPGDSSGVGSTDQALDSEYVIVGVLTPHADEQASIIVESVVPLADGLPDLGFAVGDTVDVPVDPELDGLTADGRYALFVPWNGQLGPTRFVYDLEASSFLASGSSRAHNGRTLDGIVDCLDDSYSAEVTGDRRLDAVIELVRRQSDEPIDSRYTEALNTCALS